MDNYIVSARKYRPQTFDSVVGQRSLTTTLRNAISSGKLAHAYLFCGPRGVGKTTCARIFAKTINCLNLGENGEACNECESCRAFNEGRSLNIHELDAASNNSVEDIRSIIEQVTIPPQIGRYKVFIIDEVHMLSAAAFNAFLKTLEEPPAHVIFILATTEKHKIMPTILSRCQIYDFNRMEVPDIVAHLKNVAGKEGISVEEEALNVIAQKADGGMRDALSIFDQVSSFSNGDITYQKVIENLNVLDYEYYFRIVDELLEGNITQVLLTFNEIVSKGFGANIFIGGLASHMRDLLVSKDKATLPLLEVSASVRERYAKQAERCSQKFLYKALRLCNDCDIKYNTARNKRLLVEITLIEVAQSETGDEPGDGRSPRKQLKPIFKAVAETAQTTQPQAEPAKTKASEEKAQQQAPSPQQPQPIPATPPAKLQHPKPKAKTIRPTASIKTDTHKEASSETSVAKDEGPQYGNTPYDEDKVRYAWLRCANETKAKAPAVAGLMKSMRPTLLDDGSVEVAVDSQPILDDMISQKEDISNFFRQELNNGNISVNFIKAKSETQKHLITPKEKFDDMLKRSEALRILAKNLRLTPQ